MFPQLRKVRVDFNKTFPSTPSGTCKISFSKINVMKNKVNLRILSVLFQSIVLGNFTLSALNGMKAPKKSYSVQKQKKNRKTDESGQLTVMFRTKGNSNRRNTPKQ